MFVPACNVHTSSPHPQPNSAQMRDFSKAQLNTHHAR
jgi:hypothetical protein